MKEELIKLVHKLGIAGNVFFVPEVSDTQGVLSAMDLFVMPSLKEGLGLSLMEAMASGLAVIGSDVGGIRTLIQHGHSGLLVKPSDTRGLAYAILELLGEPQKRQSFGKRAQEFIAQNFSQEKMVLKTEGVYLECLNAKS
jgi:glycosyltransferase involved in cell wall biosynthesis